MAKKLIMANAGGFLNTRKGWQNVGMLFFSFKYYVQNICVINDAAFFYTSFAFINGTKCGLKVLTIFLDKYISWCIFQSNIFSGVQPRSASSNLLSSEDWSLEFIQTNNEI